MTRMHPTAGFLAAAALTVAALLAACDSNEASPDGSPSPTATPTTTATPTPTSTGETPGHPTVDDTKPPVLVATSGSGSVPLGVGTYCWTSATGGLCVDYVGIVTVRDALLAAAGSVIDIDASELTVDGVVATAWPLPVEPVWDEDGQATIAWSPGEDEGVAPVLAVADGHISFEADLPPGDYLVVFFVQVPGGDVSYGLQLTVTETSTSGGDSVQLGEEFTLSVGEHVDLPDGWTIFFEGVESDSRCPTDVVCIWQGEAVVQLTALDNADGHTPLTLRIGGDGDNSVTLKGLRLEAIQLDPYPLASTGPTPESDYVLRAVVTPAS